MAAFAMGWPCITGRARCCSTARWSPSTPSPTSGGTAGSGGGSSSGEAPSHRGAAPPVLPRATDPPRPLAAAIRAAGRVSRGSRPGRRRSRTPGLVALLVQFAALAPGRRAVAALSPVLVVLGFAVITAGLDLLPAGAAMIWLALVPFARERGALGAGPEAGARAAA
ncbi:hypothetical protein GWI34_04220 [Actinomadura sp. DSM 109109]|nr:hypothetical protein [Actinomadura lepetitiana]